MIKFVLLFACVFLNINAAIDREDIESFEKSDIYEVVDLISIKDVLIVLIHDTYEDRYQAFILFKKEDWNCPVLYPSLVVKYATWIPYYIIESFHPGLKDKYEFTSIESQAYHLKPQQDLTQN